MGVSQLGTTCVNTVMPSSHRLNNARRLLNRRRAIRAGLTPAEATLWRALRHSSLHGRKFRRQQSIEPCVVDFYCAAERLVIELEGAAHDSDHSTNYDQAREQYLGSLGLTVVRLENRHVIENPEGVLAYISQHFRGS